MTIFIPTSLDILGEVRKYLAEGPAIELSEKLSNLTTLLVAELLSERLAAVRAALDSVGAVVPAASVPARRRGRPPKATNGAVAAAEPKPKSKSKASVSTPPPTPTPAKGGRTAQLSEATRAAMSLAKVLYWAGRRVAEGRGSAEDTALLQKHKPEAAVGRKPRPKAAAPAPAPTNSNATGVSTDLPV